MIILRLLADRNPASPLSGIQWVIFRIDRLYDRFRDPYYDRRPIGTQRYQRSNLYQTFSFYYLWPVVSSTILFSMVIGRQNSSISFLGWFPDRWPNGIQRSRLTVVFTILLPNRNQTVHFWDRCSIGSQTIFTILGKSDSNDFAFPIYPRAESIFSMVGRSESSGPFVTTMLADRIQQSNIFFRFKALADRNPIINKAAAEERRRPSVAGGNLRAGDKMETNGKRGTIT